MKDLDQVIISGEIRQLSENEIKDIGGGFWTAILRIVVPTVLNVASYVFHKKHHDEEVTPQGLAIAGGTGILSGGISVAGTAAAGGDLIGAAVWAPSSIAINASGNLIAQEY